MTDLGAISEAEEHRSGSPNTDSVAERHRRRLFVGFPPGRLKHVRQAAALFPTATSVQLPRAVDCEFESAEEAAAVVARLRQAEVTEGLLSGADLLWVDKTQQPQPSKKTVLHDRTRLHVRGIQRTVKYDQLRQLFVGCSDVTIPTANNHRGNNGYAFVQFADRQTAEAFVAQKLSLDGKALALSYAVERNLKLASDPRYEMVEIEVAPRGSQKKQMLPETDNSEPRGRKEERKPGKAANRDQVGRKRKFPPQPKRPKNGKLTNGGEEYRNKSVLMSA